jgi:hypothetical protein
MGQGILRTLIAELTEQRFRGLRASVVYFQGALMATPFSKNAISAV